MKNDVRLGKGARRAAKRGGLPGFMPSISGKNAKGPFKVKFTDEQMDRMYGKLELAEMDYSAEHGHGMPPWYKLSSVYDILFAERHGGITTREMVNMMTDDGREIKRIEMAMGLSSDLDPRKTYAHRIEIEGEGEYEFGDINLADEDQAAAHFIVDRDKKRLRDRIDKGGKNLVVQLADGGEPHAIVLGENGEQRIIELADGETSKQGSSSSDRSLIKASRDAGVYGSTTAIIGPALLREILTLRARQAPFTQWFDIGIASEMTMEMPVRTNNVVTQLFDDTDSDGSYPDLKSAVIPRQEMSAAGIFLSAEHGKYDFESIGYKLYAMISREALMSPAARILGLWQQDLNDLMEALKLIDGYDFAQSIWYGHFEGTQRRHQANGTWATTEAIPRGISAFTAANARKHWRWYSLPDSTLYVPPADANYNKYHSSTAEDAPGFVAGQAKFVEIIHSLNRMQKRKGRKLTAIQIHTDLLPWIGLDVRTLNRDWDVTVDVRWETQPGYSGTITIPMIGKVAIFVHEPGDVPVFASGDATPVNIPYLIWGGELGSMVKHSVFWSPDLTLHPGQQTISVDSNNIVVPSDHALAAIVNLRCQEVYDLDRTSFIRGVQTIHGAE